MNTSSTAKRIEALSVPGGRGRAACAKVAELAAELSAGLRRAVPFLSRRRVVVSAEPARCVAFADLASDPQIVHASAFTIKPVGSAPAAQSATMRGLILFDDCALSRILDGVLGGDGNPSSTASSPTSAQSALASRVTGTMLRAFGDVLSARLLLAVESTNAKDIAAGSAVVLPLVMEGGGKVILAIPLAAIAQDEEGPDADHVDSGIAAAMTDVELDVVAELGKVRLPLETIARLAVGDVLRLSLPLDARASISAGGATLYYGRPTASGHVVGVEIERLASDR